MVRSAPLSGSVGLDEFLTRARIRTFFTITRLSDLFPSHETDFHFCSNRADYVPLNVNAEAIFVQFLLISFQHFSIVIVWWLVTPISLSLAQYSLLLRLMSHGALITLSQSFYYRPNKSPEFPPPTSILPSLRIQHPIRILKNRCRANTPCKTCPYITFSLVFDSRLPVNIQAIS